MAPKTTIKPQASKPTKPTQAKPGKPKAEAKPPKPTKAKPPKTEKKKVTKPPTTTTTPPRVTDVRLSNIIVDMSIQPRSQGLNQEYVAELQEALKRGVQLPPGVVYELPDGSLILSEAYHRFEAHKRNGNTFIRVEIRKGTREDAALNAMASNQAHGLKRTNDDKRRAAAEVLKLKPDWSDRRIADFIGVHHDLIATQRRQVADSATSTEQKREGKDGKTYPKAEPKPKPAAEPKLEAAQENPEATNSSTADNPPDSSPETAPMPATSPDAQAQPIQTDALGIPIQPHAAQAFEIVPKFREAAALIRDAQKLITEIGEHPGGFLLINRMQWQRSGSKLGGRWSLAELDNALGVIEERMPLVTDCPYAHNPESTHMDKCPLCHGKRFVGNLKHYQVPADLIDNMKKHYTPEA